MTRRSRVESGSSRIVRSEEHTSELQSRSDLVCRLLLEKKKKKFTNHIKYKYNTYKLEIQTSLLLNCRIETKESILENKTIEAIEYQTQNNRCEDEYSDP